jgi:hypothetical protein
VLGALCFLLRMIRVAFRDRVRHRLTRGFPRSLQLRCSAHPPPGGVTLIMMGTAGTQACRVIGFIRDFS